MGSLAAGGVDRPPGPGHGGAPAAHHQRGTRPHLRAPALAFGAFFSRTETTCFFVWGKYFIYNMFIGVNIYFMATCNMAGFKCAGLYVWRRFSGLIRRGEIYPTQPTSDFFLCRLVLCRINFPQAVSIEQTKHQISLSDPMQIHVVAGIEAICPAKAMVIFAFFSGGRTKGISSPPV